MRGSDMGLVGMPEIAYSDKRKFDLADSMLGPLDAAATLATGMLSWPMGIAAGIGTGLSEQQRIPDVSPGASQGFGLTPGTLDRDKAKMVADEALRTQNRIMEKYTWPPHTDVGAAISGAVGHAIESAVGGVRKLANVDEGIWDKAGLPSITRVDPRAGYLAGIASELMLFKGIHQLGKGAKARVKKFKDMIQQDKWEQAQRVLEDIAANDLDQFRRLNKKTAKTTSEMQEGPDGPYARIKQEQRLINQLDAIRQAEDAFAAYQARPDAVGSHVRPQTERAPVPRTPEQMGAAIDPNAPAPFPQLSAGDLLSQDKYRHLMGYPNINPVIPPSQHSRPLRQQDLPNASRRVIDITPIDQEGLPTKEYQAPKPAIREDKPLPERTPEKADSRAHMEQLAALRKSVPTMVDSKPPTVKTKPVKLKGAPEVAPEVAAEPKAEVKPVEVKPEPKPQPQIDRTPNKIKDTVVEPPKPAPTLDEAVAQVEAKLPELKKWFEDPINSGVDIDAIKGEINRITEFFQTATEIAKKSKKPKTKKEKAKAAKRKEFSESAPINQAVAEDLLGPVDQLFEKIRKKQEEIKPEEGTVKDFDFFGEPQAKLVEDYMKPDYPLPDYPEVPDPVLQITTKQGKGGPKTSLSPEEVKAFLQKEDINWRQRKQQQRLKELDKTKDPEAELKQLIKEQQEEMLYDDANRLKPIDVSDVDLYGGREMVKDLTILFDDNRGSVSIGRVSAERMAALERLAKKLMKEGKNLSEYFRGLGLSEEAIAHLTKMSDQAVKKGEELKKVHAPWNGKPENVIKRPATSDKTGITEREAKAWMGVKEIPATFAHKLRESFRNPIRTFRMLGKEMKTEVYDKYREAESRIATRRKDFRETRLYPLEKRFNSKERRRMGAYWMSLQEGSKNKLRGKEILEAMGIKEIPKLTEKEMIGVQELQAEFAKFLDEVNSMRRSIGKRDIHGIDNYLSFMRSYNMMEKFGLESNPIHTPRNKIFSNYAMVSEKPVSFSKARAKTGNYSVELDPFLIMDRYSESAIRHIELSPLIAKIHKMRRGFKDSNGEFFRLKEVAPKADEFIRQWTNHIGDMTEPHTPQWLRRSVSTLSNNISMALLTYNLRSAGIQISALRNTFAEVGMQSTLKGLYSNLTPKSRNHAMFKSKHLNAREMDVSMAQLARRLRAGGDVKKLIGSLGMEPLKWLDKETARSTWLAAEDYGRRVLKLNDKELITYADDVTIKTQASGLKGDVAPIQRTALGKFVTLLQTFTINDWGFLINDVVGAKNLTTSAKAAKVMRYIIGTALISAFYEDVLGVMSPFPTPIRALREGLENDDSFLATLADVGKEPLEMVPGLGGMRFGSTPLGAGVQTVSDLTEGVQNIKDIIDDPSGFKARKTYKAVGMMGGVPGTAQMSKSFNRIMRGGEVQGLLPKQLPEELAETFSVLMGQYDKNIGKKKKGGRSRRSKRRKR
jgi:hypothetical protein